MGVSPQTLRAWANEGRVQTYRTPGGHRRFQIERTPSPAAAPPKRSEARWRLLEHSALGQLHLALDGASDSARILAGMPVTARVSQRELARQVIRLAVEGLAHGEADLNSRADGQGSAFAEWARREGVGALGGTAALAVVRSALLAGVVEFGFGMGEPNVEELGGWVARINELIDRVCLSMLQYGVDVQVTHNPK